MDLTVNDLQDTYIKLNKDVKVFQSPSDGEKNKPVWFTKSAGSIAGKLYSWIDTNPSTGRKYRYVYLMFKLNDDFAANTKAYFIRIEKKLISWEFTKQELIKKRQSNMSDFDKFVDDIERSVNNYVQDIQNTVKDATKIGLLAAGGILLTYLVVVPYIKFRIVKSTARQLIKEGRSAAQ